MLTAIVIATFTVLSALGGVWDQITNEARKKRVIGWSLVIFALIMQGVSVLQKKGQLNEIDRQEQVIEDANVLLKSNLKEVDEASGGDTYNNVAYLVDDEEAGIFTFEYLEAEDKYKILKTVPIADARPCNERMKIWEKECDDSKPVELTKKLIEDLEGAAIHDGKLYLTTAHSNSQEGEREPQRCLFLEVSLDGKVIRATRKLRDAIDQLFKKNLSGVTEKAIEELVNKETKTEKMQIEGLAIDSTTGQVYLGFRSPLVDRRALVLRTNLDQIFSDSPQFQGFVLDLEHGGDNYGIVSMEYDPDSEAILVLGNSETRTETLPTVVWTWKVGDPTNVQHPVAFNGDLFTVFKAPGSRPAKPEVILLPRANRIHLFFDAQGTGGQLSLTRSGTDLRRMGK